LENLTNGRYNVADYTKLRTETLTRIVALENAAAYTPTDVVVQSSLRVNPGPGASGTLYVSGSSTLVGNVLMNNSLNVNGLITCNQGLNVGTELQAQNAYITGDLTVDGATNIILNNVSADSATISGQVSAGTFVGNGAGLTNVNDTTKLLKSGGSMTGPLSGTVAGFTALNVTGGSNFDSVNADSLSVDGQVSAATFVGNGAQLTGLVLKVGDTMTGQLSVPGIYLSSGTITGDGAGLYNLQNVLPLIGGTLTGPLVTQSIRVDDPYTISGDGAGLVNLPKDTTKVDVAGDTMTGDLTTRNVVCPSPYGVYGQIYATRGITIYNGYTITGDGSGLYNLDDDTKLPKDGSGAMTGQLDAQDINVALGYKYYGDGSALTGVIGTDSTKVSKAGDTMTGNLTLTAPAKYYGDGSSLTGIVGTPIAPTMNYYTGGANTINFNSAAYDNYIRLASGTPCNIYFSGRVIGQKLTIIREIIQLSNGNSFYFGVGLPYRVYTLDGNVYNVVSGSAGVAINYTYAGQQKLRSVFVVLASTNATYSFDLIEIS
jgi:hypothetical protein